MIHHGKVAEKLLLQLQSSGEYYPAAIELAHALKGLVPREIRRELETLGRPGLPHTTEEKVRAATLCSALLAGHTPQKAAGMAAVAHIYAQYPDANHIDQSMCAP